jgi:hypothetical protein
MLPWRVGTSQRPRPSPGSTKATGVLATAGKSAGDTRVEIAAGADGVQVVVQDSLKQAVAASAVGTRKRDAANRQAAAAQG